MAEMVPGPPIPRIGAGLASIVKMQAILRAVSMVMRLTEELLEVVKLLLLVVLAGGHLVMRLPTFCPHRRV